MRVSARVPAERELNALKFDLNAHFDHVIGWDVEERGCALGVSRHEREQVFAPDRHTWAVGCYQRFSAEEER